MRKGVKEFMTCFINEKWLAGQAVSRLLDIMPDNGYGGRSFYLLPLPLLTKSRFQLHIREEKHNAGRTWTLTKICGGKADIDSKKYGLSDADVLRKIIEMIKQEKK